jgi:hypothetical protein
MGFEALTQGILAGAQGLAGGIERRADDLKQAKVADAFVKANENVLGELGIDKDSYSALSARDRSAAVMGYMKNLGVQEAVYKQQEMKRAEEVRKGEQAVMPHLQDLLRNAPEDAKVGGLVLQAMSKAGVTNADVLSKYLHVAKTLNEDRASAANFMESVLAQEAMKVENNNMEDKNKANLEATRANTDAVKQRTKFEAQQQKEWMSLSENRKTMAAIKKSAAKLGNRLTSNQIKKLGKEIEYLKEPPTAAELKEMKAMQVKDEDNKPTPFYLVPDAKGGHRLMHAGSDSNDSGLYDAILSQQNLSPEKQEEIDNRLAAINADLKKLYNMPDDAMVDMDGSRVDGETGKGFFNRLFTAGEMSKTEAIQRLIKEQERISGQDPLGLNKNQN